MRRRNNEKKETEEEEVGVVRSDGEKRGEGGWMEGGGTGGLTIREKFRPVKVSFLPIVLLIKTAPAPELIEGLSLSLPPPPLHPSASLSQQLVCEEERKRRAVSVQHHGATINQPPRSN